MDDQNKNLILATALSFLVILIWFVLFPPPEPDTELGAPVETVDAPADQTASVPSTAPDVPAQQTPPAEETVAEVEQRRTGVVATVR